jgi:hypothetical protein
VKQQAWQHAVVAVIIALYLQGMYLAKNVADIATLLETAPWILFPLLGAWGWKKYVEGKNGVHGLAAGDQGSAAAAGKVAEAPRAP